MDKLLEQIQKGTVWQFPGGVHPPQQKSLSNGADIARLPLPDKLVVALKQHIGANGKLLVEKGQRVLKGQALTEPVANWSVPVHAPSSGIITEIAPKPSAHPSALPELSIVIEPDGKDEWCTLKPVNEPKSLTHQELVDIIHQAGISGMGGAGFPTYIKADTKQSIDFFIVNAVECEPYITADDTLMREHAAEIIQGVELMQQLLNPTVCIVGIEDNKPEAIAAMTKAAEHNNKIIVQTVPTVYPSGGEKQLIKLLTNREVPSMGIPADIGVLMHNTGTLYAVQQAVYEGKPLIERVVTVTGNTIHKPGNVWALLGTEIKHLLDCQGFSPVPQQRVVMGGPMMGFTLPTVRIGVIKTTNCILAPDHKELAEPGPEKACIRCSACADACPASLLPQQLQWFAKSKEYDKLQEHNLFDCIECGACAYVCPSEIPLVQYYRVAKVEIKEQQAEKIKADRAKERFDARKERLDREQEERKNRHKRKPPAKSDDEKQKVADALARVKNKSSNGNEKSAVAAAIARAKAKKREGQNSEIEPDNSEVAKERALRKEQARKYKEQKEHSEDTAPLDDKKSAVAAAIARAKAKKAAQSQDGQANTNDTETAMPVDDKKAAVAAAIARAKAKKAVKATETQNESEKHPDADAPVDDKKAAVAAAITRAKAKKAVKTTETQNESEKHADTDAPVDDKKAAVAAAIARAKAKKAAKAAETQNEPEKHANTDTPVDDKKAAVAAAIARAKAKKAAKAAETHNETEEQPAQTSEDKKKAAIAAAVARAKAKKLQKEGNDQS
ncbi:MULTISPECIES: electron transport complex subunit RsxC [unclassified Pseudoalteromonas]|uniref:electron transport complex subunit RsxC n=2 Tax=Pseudoalteromonas TaxID=53246 RepID=UPI001109A6F0|nr:MULTISPECIES: electron transport complex subunit RsxC [unclassified Pseudoalteromonas]TMN85572.1 electron transport complex subunit RsxC [Pseudoalteromonas sp. S410]TMN87932.1 electron transport complex subunit RsxC [Pseudoalteromonas sp. S408]TMN94683.1 electron transport complex subunit RsxC [Pseudoalteromonas sp. S407]